MLSREHRFRGSRDIQRLYKTGKAVRTKSLGARYLCTLIQPFRAAVIVSRKVHKSAVVRNRIRRRLYELLRTKYAEHLTGGQLLVTVFDASLATAPAQAVERELANLLSKAQEGGRPKGNHDIVRGTGE